MCVQLLLWCFGCLAARLQRWRPGDAPPPLKGCQMRAARGHGCPAIVPGFGDLSCPSLPESPSDGFCQLSCAFNPQDPYNVFVNATCQPDGTWALDSDCRPYLANVCTYYADPSHLNCNMNKLELSFPRGTPRDWTKLYLRANDPMLLDLTSNNLITTDTQLTFNLNGLNPLTIESNLLNTRVVELSLRNLPSDSIPDVRSTSLIHLTVAPNSGTLDPERFLYTIPNVKSLTIDVRDASILPLDTSRGNLANVDFLGFYTQNMTEYLAADFASVWRPQEMDAFITSTNSGTIITRAFLPQKQSLHYFRAAVNGPVYVDLEALPRAINHTRLREISFELSKAAFRERIVLLTNSGTNCTITYESAIRTDPYISCHCGGTPQFHDVPHCPYVPPFSCPTAGDRTILATQICDGVPDCINGADEAECFAVVNFILPDAATQQIPPACTSLSVTVNAGRLTSNYISGCGTYRGMIRGRDMIEMNGLGNTIQILANETSGWCLYRIRVAYTFRTEAVGDTIDVTGVAYLSEGSVAFLNITNPGDESRPSMPSADEFSARWAAAVREFEATTTLPTTIPPLTTNAVNSVTHSSADGVAIIVVAAVAGALVLVFLLVILVCRHRRRTGLVMSADKLRAQWDMLLTSLPHSDMRNALFLIHLYVCACPTFKPSLQAANVFTLDCSLHIPCRHHTFVWMPSRRDVQLGEELGSGNFGRVLHGLWSQDKGSAIPVAIKFITTADGMDWRSQLLKEAVAMNTIGQHPHVIQLHGLLMTPFEDETVAFVMEFAAHGDLRSYLQREDVEFGVAHTLQAAHQVALALGFISKQGLVHRDVAARNVLVFEDQPTMLVKLTDFGLARVLSQHQEYYRSAQDDSLPFRWMAPEAITQRRFSEKSDVWSFGVLLFELTTRGRAPYGNQSNPVVLQNIARGYVLRSGSLNQSNGQALNRLSSTWEERMAATTIRFAKMHGLGNDFVVVDSVRQSLPPLGSSWLLVIEPPPASGPELQIDFVYRIFNADGSEVGQCGNGARCLAAYVYRYHLAQAGAQLRVRTRNSELTMHGTPDGAITVNMGCPKFDPAQVPLLAPARADVYHLALESGATICCGAVSMGNPHLVTLVDDVGTAPVLELGPQLESHARCPERANVGFMQIVDAHSVRLRVFERGAGETRACGSGACAAVAVGIVQDRLLSPVTVSLPGGVLEIAWAGFDAPLYMTGPAAHVFEGLLPWPANP
ncbi:uncharacterized protein MONBRDRAFT_34165 [Monosiga brevicollis MX1]|uniref:diaminopimelate epimerase n=1 Tax=Monosiga brevicollis TaxID=81824 RepID=A9V9Z1_MONBE|nr:uncharacterized protein MONBRDRAFT_34165 [Monosiga brevicollis MX1]EDQ85572.1 predicted protein [Monosiga brevicollis MX1]|eukprot:XP_001749521.1 hypothetical protein [Monosiga brevicollis MX1]